MFGKMARKIPSTHPSRPKTRGFFCPPSSLLAVSKQVLFVHLLLFLLPLLLLLHLHHLGLARISFGLARLSLGRIGFRLDTRFHPLAFHLDHVLDPGRLGSLGNRFALPPSLAWERSLGVGGSTSTLLAPIVDNVVHRPVVKNLGGNRAGNFGLTIHFLHTGTKFTEGIETAIECPLFLLCSLMHPGRGKYALLLLSMDSALFRLNCYVKRFSLTR
ncbi:MAG: hypothetical protein J3R72DRAFT_175480, partial [Linnemannia gamsii]